MCDEPIFRYLRSEPQLVSNKKNLTCIHHGLSMSIIVACCRLLVDAISEFATIILAFANLEDSASAAIAFCSCSGRLMSLLEIEVLV